MFSRKRAWDYIRKYKVTITRKKENLRQISRIKYNMVRCYAVKGKRMLNANTKIAKRFWLYKSESVNTGVEKVEKRYRQEKKGECDEKKPDEKFTELVGIEYSFWRTKEHCG